MNSAISEQAELYPEEGEEEQEEGQEEEEEQEKQEGQEEEEGQEVPFIWTSCSDLQAAVLTPHQLHPSALEPPRLILLHLCEGRAGLSTKLPWGEAPGLLRLLQDNQQVTLENQEGGRTSVVSASWLLLLWRVSPPVLTPPSRGRSQEEESAGRCEAEPLRAEHAGKERERRRGWSRD